MGTSDFESQSVNGNKDFHIELTDNELNIICYNGTFDGTTSKITWKDWQQNFGHEVYKAKNRCDFNPTSSSMQIGSPVATVNNNQLLYPVGWLPYLADWKNAVLNNGPFFRYNDPSEINGVGVLLGIFHGMMFGSNLKNQTCEFLPFYDQAEGHYSWVLAPDSNILYKWNDKLSIDKRNYTRHSELNAGKPVVCAGEMYLTQGVLNEIYIELNDSSGHYKPDGGSCFKYVLDEFEKIGISRSNVQLYARNP